MNYFLVLIIIFFLNCKNLPASSGTLNSLSLSNRELIRLEREVRLKQITLESLKKTMVRYFLKKHFNEEKTFLDLPEDEFWTYLEKYKLSESLYKRLEREIKNEEAKLKILKETYERFLKAKKEKEERQLAEKTSKEGYSEIYDPITELPIKVGKYSKKLKSGISIKAPISGVIKKLSFREGKAILVIENEECIAYLEGLENMRVSLGENIKAKEILGESGEHPFMYEISCKK